MLTNKLVRRIIVIPLAGAAIAGAILLLGKPFSRPAYKSTFKPQTYFVSIDKSASLSDSDFENISQYEFVFDFRTYFSQSQIDSLHQLSPQIKVLKYLNVGHVFEGTREFNEISANNPEWFTVDSSGTRVRTRQSQAYVMDPGNSGYQSWLATKAKTLIERGYDGVQADAFYYPPFPPHSNYYTAQPVNPKTGSGYTVTEWLAAKNALLTTMKNGLGSKLLTVNGYMTGRVYYRFGSGGLLAIVDGVWIEGFVRWPYDKLSVFRSGADWKKDIDLLKEVSAKGKLIIAETQFLQGQENTTLANQIKMYAFSSYLLGANGLSYFEFNTLNPTNSWQNESLPFKHYNVNIGNPINTYYLGHKIYQRDFSNGKVLVNPTNTTYSIRFQTHYRTLSGKITRSVKMGPHTGVILLKK